MDCRTLMLGLCLTGLGLGCFQSTQSATRPPAPAPAPVISKREAKKREPHAETCVALAACKEREAEKVEDNSAKQDMYEQARLAYQQALKIDPKSVQAYTGLAHVYMNMSHYDRALETYHKAVEKFPKDATVWYDLGICHCRTKHWELAIRSLQKTLELEPENRSATKTLGFCLARAGRIQESLDMLVKVMPPAEAHYNVARMLQHLERKDLCMEHLHKALEIDPGLTQARTLLARLSAPPAARGAPSAGRPVAQIHFED